MMLLQRRSFILSPTLSNVSRLPVKWVDKSILVADQALINPPYTVDSVVSVTAALNGNTEENAKSALLARVRHVVCALRRSWLSLVVTTRTHEIGNQFYVKGTRGGS